MRNIVALVLLSVFLNSNALATDPVRPVEISPPIIEISDPKLKAISLSELNVDSEIIDNIATSTYELTFFNPNSRVLEGELVFSLFEGQSVIDYALKINGKYRSASAVPKAKAKEAFENTIRAQIDPALLEKTIGNNFKTRIYPIPANGFKRIKITVQETLDTTKSKVQFRVPFVSKVALKKLNLNVMLMARNNKPITNYEGFTFDKVAEGYSLKLEKNNAVIAKPITVELNSNGAKGVFVKTLGSQKYIYTSLKQDQNLASLLNNSLRKPSNNIAIIWSDSYSNNSRNIEKDLRLLEGVLQKNAVSTVQMIFQSNRLDTSTGTFQICANNTACPSGKSISYLKNLIKRRKFDGTSDHSQIDISQIKADEVLFFTNGIRTLYDTAEVKNFDKPVTLINSSIKADTALLKKYAKLSNGRFVDLTKLNKVEALKLYFSKTTQLRVLGTSSNLDKNDVYAEIKNGRINVLSKMKQAAGKYLGWVKIEVKRGRQRIEKLIRFQNPVAVEQSLDSFWAAKKIENLSFDYKKNKQQIIWLAKRYKVLTNDMSLIVLDRVEDYVRYEIQSPVELRAQYTKLIKVKNRDKANKQKYEKELALINSIKLLRKQNQWYGKVFEKTKPQPVKPIVTAVSNDAEEIQASMPSPMVQPTPMMRPRLAMAAPARRAAPRAPSPKKVVSARKTELKAKITLKSFNPNAAYIKEIKRLDRSKWIETYHRLKKSYLTQPMFYVDIADLFYKNNYKAEAVIILSNVLELDFENSEYLRVFAFKAMELGRYDLAIRALRQVKKLRPFEPQSARDLGLAYEKAKQPQKALAEFYSILINKWDDRFNGIKIVVINEMNHLLAKNKNLDKRKIDKRLLSELLVDLRIVINWSSDNTDIDLWVIDPYNEKTYYSNNESRIGGKISNDMTRGYGPEEFMIKDAVPGVYKIQAEYYGNTQQKAAIPVTIRAEVYSNYSKASEVQKNLVLRLSNKKAVIDVGNYRYGE